MAKYDDAITGARCEARLLHFKPLVEHVSGDTHKVRILLVAFPNLAEYARDQMAGLWQ
jgi:hypothetical protein